MFDLNEEFDKLVEEFYNSIRIKQVKGELSREEADTLADKLKSMIENYNADTSNSSWDSSGCAWESSNCF